MDGPTEHPLLHPDELAADAWAAMGRQDADATLRLWRALREHSPERADAHIWPIQVLWQSGRVDEADQMADAAFARFPDHPELLVQHAWVAMAQRRWDEAARRWAAVRARAPERIEGYLWGARALWLAGRLDAAEALAAEALKRRPLAPEAMAQSAWIASSRNDWSEALRRWVRLHEAYPERRDAQVGAIQALRMVGRADETEALATAALAQHPDDPDLLVEHVWAAAARRDWTAAAARLEVARGKTMGLAAVEAGLSAVEHWIRAQTASEGGAAMPAPSPAVASAPRDDAAGDMAPSQLMLRFESLGERCDFGAVQRHFGVEPLGLLRFAWSRFDCLLAALEDRFAAIGTVEDTGFDAFGDETILRMRKYDLIFHTFVYGMNEAAEDKRETFRAQQRRRLSFLKDKLVADLEEPQKICVYSTNEAASDAHAGRLFAALRAYGPNALLYVRPADHRHLAGSVEMLEEGLYAGYFPGLTDFLAGNQPPMELWRQLCAQTYRLAQAARPAAG